MIGKSSMTDGKHAQSAEKNFVPTKAYMTIFATNARRRMGYLTDQEKTIAEIREWAEYRKRYSEGARHILFLISELDRKDEETRSIIRGYEEVKRLNFLEYERLREENRKLREERDNLQQAYDDAEMRASDAIAERNDAQQEIERLREEREIRKWKLQQADPDEIDLDWYNHIARDILKECGVNINES